MSKFLKSIVHKLVRLKNCYDWQKQSKEIVKRVKSPGYVLPLPKCKSLILIPHVDDEWIGCSQILQSGSECILCYMDMLGGDSNDIHKARLKELQNVTQFYNLQLEVVQDNKMDKLVEIIQSEEPNLVLLPFYIDWHHEHIKIMEYFYCALNKLRHNAKIVNFRIAMYQVSVPILPIKGTHYMPMSKIVWKYKWKQFKKFYKTQTIIPYQRFAYNECINGRYFKEFAAELFSVLDVDEWVIEYEKVNLTEKDKQNLKNSLGNLVEMRKNVQLIYDKVF